MGLSSSSVLRYDEGLVSCPPCCRCCLEPFDEHLTAIMCRRGYDNWSKLVDDVVLVDLCSSFQRSNWFLKPPCSNCCMTWRSGTQKEYQFSQTLWICLIMDNNFVDSVTFCCFESLEILQETWSTDPLLVCWVNLASRLDDWKLFFIFLSQHCH